MQCGDPEVSRRELLDCFEGFVRHYPSSPRAERFRKEIEILKRMIAEDAEHADKRPGKTKREQVTELIFQLREQKGHQERFSFYDIFGRNPVAPTRQGSTTPAHQLLAMGYEAVPQLIDVLEDERLTRWQ